MSRLSHDVLHVMGAWGFRARIAARAVGARRLLITAGFLVIAVFVARFSWSIPLLGDAERGLYDVRAWVMAPVVAEQDRRIVLLEFNEDTMRQTAHRSPLDRGLLAGALTALDAMHPKAIGVDILIDQKQPEDERLQGALRAMKTPTRLAAINEKTNEFNIRHWQEQIEDAFLRAAEEANPRVARASVRVSQDADTVIRDWPSPVAGQPALLSLSLLSSPPRASPYVGAIRWRRASASFLVAPRDAPVFVELPIQWTIDPERQAFVARFVAGRYVLIGAKLSDTDLKKTSGTLLTGDLTPGLEIHADMLAQALDGDFPPLARSWGLDLMALAFVAAGALTGILPARPALAPVVFGAQLVVVATVPAALQALHVDTTNVPQFGWTIGWLIAYMAAAAAARSVTAEERQFARLALGKFLPRDVAERILRDPSLVALNGTRLTLHAVLTDLEGFTELSATHPPEIVRDVLNPYLNLVSQTVREHGGTIDKFVGDSVVAFWGAPIPRIDDAERASRAAIAMWRMGERFRRTPTDGRPALGRTRVGVHRGEAVVGNFGGEVRLQYTAIGDVMNTASRLEGANKQLETRILISREALPLSMADQCRAMGRVLLRGREHPVEVFEPALDFPIEVCPRLNEAWARFDAGDVAALEEIRSLAADYPDDRALANLVQRLAKVGPGGAFQLK